MANCYYKGKEVRSRSDRDREVKLSKTHTVTLKHTDINFICSYTTCGVLIHINLLRVELFQISCIMPWIVQSLWSEWSSCSRSCGGGAAYRTKAGSNCDKERCPSEFIRYKICNIQVRQLHHLLFYLKILF